MNKFNSDGMEKKIKCYYKKIGEENSYLTVFDDKYGVLLRNKDNESALVISSEKNFFKLPKRQGMKEIEFRDGMKKAIAMMLKKSGGVFPMDALAFSNIFLKVFTSEFAKVKHKKSTMPPIQCKGG